MRLSTALIVQLALTTASYAMPEIQARTAGVTIVSNVRLLLHIIIYTHTLFHPPSSFPLCLFAFHVPFHLLLLSSANHFRLLTRNSSTISPPIPSSSTTPKPSRNHTMASSSTSSRPARTAPPSSALAPKTTLPRPTSSIANCRANPLPISPLSTRRASALNITTSYPPTLAVPSRVRLQPVPRRLATYDSRPRRRSGARRLRKFASIGLSC